ncbi:uncharacterized protein LOC121589197 [Anopheles merus]|uniref:uncharacterized protein LOC121589197 n=1 Tax=Anopheles merus TaxID=30066 RepID=UPI001BE4974E|nr:uncharacterized protein LOC121589197 [Anopheles merus]
MVTPKRKQVKPVCDSMMQMANIFTSSPPVHPAQKIHRFEYRSNTSKRGRVWTEKQQRTKKKQPTQHAIRATPQRQACVTDVEPTERLRALREVTIAAPNGDIIPTKT